MTASLLDRISLPNDNSIGPVRSRGNRAGGTSPYNRNQRPPPKGDVNGTWTHDLYQGTDAARRGGSLSARLSNSPINAPKMNFGVADRALRDALGEKGLSIKGASSRGNVVEVAGLANGTSAADVEAIFKRCGPITQSVLSKRDPPIVRVTFKHEKDAQAAVAKFDGQPADGRTLSVRVVGGVNATLFGRLEGAAMDSDSVDLLMDDGGSSGSQRKLRSDDILAKDTRARVLVAPPGLNPADYVQRPTRGGRGRGRGRGRRGGGRGDSARMDID
ncbi:uncharacterized protein B0H18DRAFT_1087048 [Fomitopsis serialis]|uniref:uncharacterized protein n=1 Tax=Fomitopsis serialis TaxID=139415 RepID=UPI0020076104|nr:uncharacterized protein B0H18DRAFT_1087048 [Neoantrodia serialis]KAH9917547.1 hypothetical protein B0H18DRAFT_1087048 [Neoantrodia serialis]